LNPNPVLLIIESQPFPLDNWISNPSLLIIESQPFLLMIESQGRVGDPIIKRKGWDSIIKREGLGFNHKEGRVGIQLSRGKGWRSNYQEGR
jgi:hypothetical protein